MTKQVYDIIAWCDRTYYAQVSIEANSPEDALERARHGIHEADGEECDNSWEWNRFRVEDASGNTVLEHQDDPIRLQLAAPRLLQVLKSLTAAARTFRNVPYEQQAWTSVDDDALEAAFAAIAEATGASPLEPSKPIVIEVRGGIVQDVLYVPPGFEYEVKDCDTIEADEEAAAGRSKTGPKPMLLEALKRCIPIIEENCPDDNYDPAYSPEAEVLALARAAIAGQTGQPSTSEPTNQDRAGWASDALAVFTAATFSGDHPDTMQRGDLESAITDLITDLLHLADQKGFDPQRIFEQGKAHFKTEVLLDG